MDYENYNKENNSSLNGNNQRIVESPVKPESSKSAVKIITQNNCIVEEGNNDSFEALEKMCKETRSNPNNDIYYLHNQEQKTSHAGVHEALQITVMEEERNIAVGGTTAATWQSDESFEVIEKMCNKTISDPNTTLFQYMHCESKQQFLEDIKSSLVETESQASLDTEIGDITQLNNTETVDFNDTIEEVDYIIKKSLEYMALQSAADVKTANKENQTLKSLLLPRFKDVYNFTSPTAAITAAKFSPCRVTPTKPKKLGESAGCITKPKSPGRLLIKIPTKSATKPRTPNRFIMNIQPIPKVDIFKKPTVSASPTTTTQFRRDRENFSHIVSPIAAYINNSGTSPLISRMKTKSEQKDILNATAFNELALGNTGNATTDSTKLADLPNKSRKLPKKAYISSIFKHVVDERTAVTIPCASSIHKYLESATLPAVVCHEGKMKIGGDLLDNIGAGRKPTNILERRDKSLADLSVMAGDISLYTIKDAQKY